MSAAGVLSVTVRRLARAVLAAAALAAAGAVQAAGWLLASPDPQAVPGEAFEVVVIAPPGAEPPERLAARIALPDGGPQIATELVAAGPAERDARQRRYLGRWPREVIGVATLSLVEAPSARMLVDAAAGRRSAVAPAAAGSLDPMAPVAPAAAPAAPNALAFHEPMYFVVGGQDPESARFQVSFRYRIFDALGVVAETFPLVRGLYFGYTQTSVWDLSSDSKPFRDTSFRPSLFYEWVLSDPDSGGRASLAGGYEHESNGKDGADTRSIDTLFLQPELRHYLADGVTYVGLIPKLWVYLDKDENRDIPDYRGYGQLGLRFGRDDGLLLAALLRRGSEGHGSTQLDLSYPLRRSVFSGVGAFLHFQYFRGYGETLRDYNESNGTQYRVGFSLVR
jgi:outer membrane phospholipase A